MKNLIMTVLALVLFTFSNAQQNSFIGDITNDFGKALERAHVLVLNADDMSYVQGTVTNENGNFEFGALAEGDYIISVDHISFESPKIFGKLIASMDGGYEFEKLNPEINMNEKDSANSSVYNFELSE